MAGATVNFEIFFLILWILITVALLILAVLRKLTLPNFIRGDKRMTGIFAFLQLFIFVMLLAALGTDQWSYRSVPGGHVSYGVAKAHGTYGDTTYSSSSACSGLTGSEKDACHTVTAAGAFTLIFGLVAIFTSFVLTIVVICSFLGVPQVEPAKPFVDIMANVQWICLLAMVMIWSVAGHDELRQISSSLVDRVGDSWILALVTTICAVTSAFFFAGGTGESWKGDATSAGPAPQNTANAPAVAPPTGAAAV